MRLHSLRFFILCGLILSLYCSPLYGQINESANTDNARSERYKKYQKRIVFTEKEEGANQTDFLGKYVLTNKSNLFMNVFLDKPLTAYLSELAPSLSLDSLVKIGNYQFTFYVDERQIYRTNLLPGAPAPSQQQQETNWSRPLIDNQHEGGLWTQSAWNRFMYNGGDDALTDGKHILKIEIRPYVQTEELKEGDIIASGSLKISVNRKVTVNVRGVSLSPVKPYEGFALSSEDFDRQKIKELKAHIEADVFKHVKSLVIVKNGCLIVEEYFNGAGRDSLHDVRSVGKSFASTLAGMAIDEGYLKSENETLTDFYDLRSYRNYSSAKCRVTLKQLLTMSSEFDGDDDDGRSVGNEENMYPTENWVKFALDLPMDTVKYSGQWHYFTTGVVLLGDILNQVVPEGLEKYADSKLFKPLGITNYRWEYTPQRVVNTAGGIRMRALDLAKYGQLYQNKGKWKGKKILPEEWIRETFTKHQTITGRKGEYYGYLFWNKVYQYDGKNYEAFYCSGNGGNKIFIFKDLPIVIVITATAYGTAYAHQQADKMMEQFILPAVVGD